MTPQTKDTMIKFRSTIRGKNSKGGDRVQLYLTTEETQSLIKELEGTLNNERGCKLDMHITKKTATDSGRQFDSTIAFVRATSESGFQGSNEKVTYVDKKSAFTDKVAKAKKELA